LIVLPWSGFWERNYFAQSWPALGPLIANNFVRGGISGLGLVNLVAGFAELVPVLAARERHDSSTGGHAPPRYQRGADTRVEP
jgi:hypothetical protein